MLSVDEEITVRNLTVYSKHTMCELHLKHTRQRNSPAVYTNTQIWCACPAQKISEESVVRSDGYVPVTARHLVPVQRARATEREISLIEVRPRSW